MRNLCMILLISMMFILTSCATNDVKPYPPVGTEESAPNNPFPQLDPRDF